jgi:hypothetical protein
MTMMKRGVSRLICTIACGLAAPFAQACDITQWDPVVTDAARLQHVNAVLIRAVIQVESNGCERLEDKPITSAAGAMGLMQLLPATWSVYRDRLKLGEDPYEPLANIIAGTAYLHDLIQARGLFDGLAAYFAGPKTVAEQQVDDKLPSTATLSYVRDVLAVVVQETRRPSALSPAAHPTSSGLFAVERSKAAPSVSVRSHTEQTLFAITHAHKIDKVVGADRRDIAP